VLKGGAAEQAGIKVGDVILALDGTPVRSPNHLQALVAMRRAGQKVRLTIWRDGKTIEKVVTLRPRDQGTTAARAEAGSEEESSEGKPAVDLERLGLAVAPLSPEKREQLEIDSGIEVTRVKAYSPAWEQGLRRGDVITHVGNTPVKSVAEFRRLLGQRKPGDAVLLRVLSVAPNGEVIERLVAIELPS
jgi:serine protease Do